MHLGLHTCTSEMITLSRNLLYHSTLTNALNRHTCTSDLIKLGSNLMYHPILTNSPNRHTCKTDLNIQVPNVSFQFEQRS